MGTKRSSRLLQIVLAFIATLLLLQPVSVFAIPQDPNQGGPNANSWTLAERAKQWALAQAFARCISKSDPGGALDKVTTSELQAGNWFAGFGSNTIYTAPSFLSSGSHNESDYSPRGVGNPNGVMDCNNIAKEVSSSFIGDGKFSDMEDMFCTVYNEPKRADDSACRKSNGGQGDYQATSVSANTVLSRISEKVWGTTISLDDAGRYIIYRAAFNEFCKPTQTDTPAPEYKYVVKEYDTTANKIIDTTYAGSRKNTDLTGTYVYATYAKTVGTSDPPGAKESCKSMVESLNKYAGAYGLWAVTHPQEAQDTLNNGGKNSGGDTTGSTCAVDGIGWIVCPIITVTAKIVDAMYNIVSNLLTVQPIISTGSTKPLYEAWSSMRNIANIVFILAFLVVIYSQLTGAGITNYGVKKLLPKVILAAILVNVSYWLCALAVDLSNIVGSSISSLLGDNIGGMIKTPDFGNFSDGGGWQGVVGPVLAFTLVGTIGWLALGSVITFLPIVLIAILTAFLTLAIRQALIIILIVISPFAFVAYLLPNTASWFKKWLDLFKTMLLMFPLVSLVFGGSSLASQIIMSSGDDWLTKFIGAAVAVIPLFITPVLLKTAGGLLGSIANGLRNSGIVKGAQAGMQKRADRTAQNIRNARDMRALRTNPDGTNRRRFSMRRGGIRSEVMAEEIKKQRDATVDTFGNTDARASAARRRAVYAQETASKTGEILQNEEKLRHLNENHDLHTQATEAAESYKTAHETHSNDAIAAHMQTNPGMYDDLSRSKGGLQNRQLEQTRRFEGSAEGRVLADERQGLEDEVATVKAEQKTDYLGSTGGQTRSVTRKNAEQAANVADKRTTRDAKQSAQGQTQAVEEKQVDDEIAIADSDAEVAYLATLGGSTTRQAAVNAKDVAANAGQRETNAAKASATGRTTSQEARRLKKEGDAVELEDKIDFAQSLEGQALSVQEQQLEGELELAKADNKELFESSDEGVDLAVQLDAAKTQADVTKARQTTEATQQNVDLKVAADAAETAAETAKTRVKTEATEQNADLLVDKDAADTELEIAKTRVEDQAIVDNADLNVAKEAAKAERDVTKADFDAMVEEVKTEAGAEKLGVQDNPTVQSLQQSDLELRAQRQRKTAAESVAVGEYAKKVQEGAASTSSPGETLAEVAGGIVEHGDLRAIATAVQVSDKQQVEAITTQKSTQESDGVDKLMTTMMDTSLPAERRAAAAGLVMSRGGDQHVQEVLDYLGTIDDDTDTIALMQKQVASDIGSRKPQGFGRTDLSRLAQGKFGMNNTDVTKDQRSPRGFEDNLLGRVNDGKVGAEEIANMGADELARLAHIVQTRDHELQPGVHEALVKSINKIQTVPTLKGKVDSPEQTKLLAGITSKTGVNGAIRLQNLEFERTRTQARIDQDAAYKTYEDAGNLTTKRTEQDAAYITYEDAGNIDTSEST